MLFSQYLQARYQLSKEVFHVSRRARNIYNRYLHHHNHHYATPHHNLIIPFASASFSSTSTIYMPENRSGHQTLLDSSYSGNNMHKNTLSINNMLPHTISNETFEAMSFLPEIQSLATLISSGKDNKHAAVDSSLKRAHDIFSKMSPEYNIGILALQAHYKNMFHDLKASSQVLREIKQIEQQQQQAQGVSIDSSSVLLSVLNAQAKVEWKAGNFYEAQRISMEMQSLHDSKQNNESKTNENITIVKERQDLCVKTSLALSKLLLFSCNYLYEHNDDPDSETIQKVISSFLNPLYEVSNYFQDKYDKNNNVLDGLMAARTLSNYAIAQMMIHYTHTMYDRDVDDNESQKQKATNSIKEAISILDSILDNGTDIDNNISKTTKAVKADLLCTLAKFIIYPSHDDKERNKKITQEDVSKASELCRGALVIYEEFIASDQQAQQQQTNDDGESKLTLDSLLNNNNKSDMMMWKPFMANILTLIASCYARTGSAVTSQGLLESSMDKLTPSSLSSSSLSSNNDTGDALSALSPYAQLWYRDLLGEYVNLCQNWEKREKDAEKLNQRRQDFMEKHIMEGWRYQPSITSGLFFPVY